MVESTSCIEARTPLSLPIFLALEIRQIPIVSTWLNVQSLGLIDIAISCCGARKKWLIMLKTINSHTIDTWSHSHSSMKWVMTRNIRLSQVLLDCHHHSDTISDLTFGADDSRTSFGDEVIGDRTLFIWGERKYLSAIDLSGCEGITGIGLSTLVRGCVQLQTINLTGCDGITDIGVSALAHGCSQMQTLNLTGCKRITESAYQHLDMDAVS
jgi:Leucine Rich repeat